MKLGEKINVPLLKDKKNELTKEILALLLDTNTEKYNKYPSNLDEFSALKNDIWNDITKSMYPLYKDKDNNFIDSFKN
jgi:hypothetical protein